MIAIRPVLITVRQTQIVLINLDRLNAIVKLVTLEMASVAMVGFYTYYTVPMIPVTCDRRLDDWVFFFYLELGVSV